MRALAREASDLLEPRAFQHASLIRRDGQGRRSRTPSCSSSTSTSRPQPPARALGMGRIAGGPELRRRPAFILIARRFAAKAPAFVHGREMRREKKENPLSDRAAAATERQGSESIIPSAASSLPAEQHTQNSSFGEVQLTWSISAPSQPKQTPQTNPLRCQPGSWFSPHRGHRLFP